jgi:hypothetical protein
MLIRRKALFSAALMVNKEKVIVNKEKVIVNKKKVIVNKEKVIFRSWMPLFSAALQAAKILKIFKKDTRVRARPKI